ncbi:hypothetical protein QYF36_006159 [Acer negundo]|nr:hypothetical protein QYF36_006159 [Acer negundo]
MWFEGTVSVLVSSWLSGGVDVSGSVRLCGVDVIGSSSKMKFVRVGIMRLSLLMLEEDQHSLTASPVESAARNDQRSGEVFWLGEHRGVGDSSGLDDGVVAGSIADTSATVDAAVLSNRNSLQKR